MDKWGIIWLMMWWMIALSSSVNAEDDHLNLPSLQPKLSTTAKAVETRVAQVNNTTSSILLGNKPLNNNWEKISKGDILKALWVDDILRWLWLEKPDRILGAKFSDDLWWTFWKSNILGKKQLWLEYKIWNGRTLNIWAWNNNVEFSVKITTF